MFNFLLKFFKKREEPELVKVDIRTFNPYKPTEGQLLMYNGDGCYSTGYVYKVYDQYFIIATGTGIIRREEYFKNNENLTLITRNNRPVIASKELIENISKKSFEDKCIYEDEVNDKIEENKVKIESEVYSKDIDEIEEIRDI